MRMTKQGLELFWLLNTFFLFAEEGYKVHIKMSAIGSLVFCADCGNLLDSSTGNRNTILVCDCCGAENKGQFHHVPGFVPLLL
jgi:hypothetical protein